MSFLFSRYNSSWTLDAGYCSNAASFDDDISQWNVSRVTNMNAMFHSASAFNQDLSQWEVSRVTTFESMFEGASSFSQSLCWDIPDDATTTSMFLDANIGASAKAFNTTTLRTAVTAWCNNSATAAANYGDISAWCTGGVEDMSNLFGDIYVEVEDSWQAAYCSTRGTFNDNISSWDVSRVYVL
jgi:surface protein